MGSDGSKSADIEDLLEQSEEVSLRLLLDPTQREVEARSDPKLGALCLAPILPIVASRAVH